MARVYLAEDLKQQRKVAVKVLRPELAAVLGAPSGSGGANGMIIDLRRVALGDVGAC